MTPESNTSNVLCRPRALRLGPVVLAVGLGLAGVAGAGEDAPAKDRTAELKERTEALARRMDELSAEAQDLVWNHTNPKLTEFLKGIDGAMLDARDLLEAYRTDGETVAAEQDVLEKIYEAAKKAAQQPSAQPQPQPQPGQQGEGQQGQGSQQDQQNQQGLQAMLRMMENMLGITPTEQPGQGQGGSQPGQGAKGPGTGSGAAARGPHDKEMTEERTVPKAAGNPAGLTPPEFREPLEAFHRALDDLDRNEARPASGPTQP